MKRFKWIRFAILSTLIVLLVAPAYGQKRGFRYKSAKPFTYGADAGMTFSNIIPNNNPSSKYKVGYYGGGFAEVTLPKNLSVLAEINFKATGGESVPTSIVFNPSAPFLKNVTSIDLMMYGVELPVTIKYNVPGMYPETFVGAGLCGTYNLKAQAALYNMSSTSNVYTTTTTYVDVTDKVQKMAGSVLVNAGAKIPLGKVDLMLKAEFQINVNDLSGNNEVAYNGFRSKTFKIGVGVGF